MLKSFVKRIIYGLESRKNNAITVVSNGRVSKPRLNLSSEDAPHKIEDDLECKEERLEWCLSEWKLRGWKELCVSDQEFIKQYPERGSLALLTAVEFLHQDHKQLADESLRLAKDWGCSKTIIVKTLVAAVHNTLGRASRIVDEDQRSNRNFQIAAEIFENDDINILLDSRAKEFLSAPSSSPLFDRLNNDGNLQKSKEQTRFQLEILNEINLGCAWSGNTVNTAIFRHHGVLTSGIYQYCAFYVDEKTLRLIRRDLTADKVTTYDLKGEYNLYDAHNVVSIGIDRDNIIHIMYDHHATSLRYRKSEIPQSIEKWSDELTMTGVHESRITYPTFILPRNGFPLTLLYRDGTHNNGTARLKTYCEQSQAWSDKECPILSGSGNSPWTSNAYWNSPAIGSDGSIHLSFVWRTHLLGSEGLINNINIDYALTNDNGESWKTSNQLPYRIPITQVNSETIWASPPGANLINQCGMAVDRKNHPHIVFYSNDNNGVPQYRHLWFNGIMWRQKIISNRKMPFALKGGGTLQIPISRPEIVLDEEDNVYVIYRGDLTSNRMVIMLLAAPNYNCVVENIIELSHDDLGFSEPVIDRARWHRDNILTILTQHNLQPDGDSSHSQASSTVKLLDIRLSH